MLNISSNSGEVTALQPNLRLKFALILQSFSFLFLILLIKNFDPTFFELIRKFFIRLISANKDVLYIAITHDMFFSLVVDIISLFWLILTVVSAKQFADYQTAGYIDNGENIKIKEEITDSGVLFFVTYVLPMIIDDFSKLQDFIAFCIMLVIIIILMWRTNLYYQNPVVTLLGYKIYRFEFQNPESNCLKGKELIAVSYGRLDEQKIVKWIYISDDVLIVRNKNGSVKHDKR